MLSQKDEKKNHQEPSSKIMAEKISLCLIVFIDGRYFDRIYQGYVQTSGIVFV